MAAFDYVQNLYDVALKPRLLRSLINEHIPDETQQLRNSLVLSHIVSAIKTHELLSEQIVVQSVDNKKLIEKWKSAVDLWIDRVLMLVSSNMPDKSWAGICLLGVTYEGCSSERFLASYSAWFQKLLSHLQPPAESHFVKVACCVSLSDLLTRLSGYPNMKRDGASHAAKLLQPVLKLINEDSSDAEGAVSLLCTILTLFPTSLQKNYDSAEAAIVTKIMSGKCNPNLLKKLALCLSLLPKSRGDEDSWTLMIQKILIAINFLLNASFHGLEEETTTKEIMRALVLPGKDLPVPLGGLTIFDISNKTTSPERVLLPSISALMLCCCTMLTTSYPVQVKVPVKPLLMLVGRILLVDGSIPNTLYPTTTAMQQEYICLELPALHSYSLDILSAIIKRSCSQVLPNAAQIMRIVTEYLGKTELTDLRIKVYALIKLMMLSMGVGLAIFLAEDIVRNAFIDLGSAGDSGGEACSSSEAFLKKRKHEIPTTLAGNQPITSCSRNNPIYVKIAALEAIETLLTVGGAVGKESWRPNVNSLVMNVAIDACKGGWTKPTYDFNSPYSSISSWADYQLASLRALLTSLLSPGRICSQYLAQGLELFRKGGKMGGSINASKLFGLTRLLLSFCRSFSTSRLETGTKLAGFCAHALMALEVLIHPRAIPLIDFGSSIEYPIKGAKNMFTDKNTHSGAQKHNLFPGSTSGNEPENPESEEDNLYEKWIKDSDNEPPATDQEKNTTAIEIASSSSANVVHDDKGNTVLVDTQSVVEVNKQTEILSQTADFTRPSDMEISDLDTKGKTHVSGSIGGIDSMIDLGYKDDPMDEIPDIVDLDPDSE